MAVYRARVTSKGQVTVPVHVRKALDLRVGDEIASEVDPDGVRVRPMRHASHFSGVMGRWRRGEGASAESTDAWLRQMRVHEHAHGG